MHRARFSCFCRHATGRSSCTRHSFLTLTLLLLCPTITFGAAKPDPRLTEAARERVHRNRAVSSAVTRISEQLRPGCDVETLRLVQWALDIEPDAFNIQTSRRLVGNANAGEGDKPPLVSLHSAVESMLSRSGREVLDRYETQFGEDANLALADARANQSLASLRRVCRRFFLTAAGYAAAEDLVIHWLDAGEYGLANRLATHVLAEPVHHDRISPRLREIANRLNAINDVSGGSTLTGPALLKFQRQFNQNRKSVELFESGWMTQGGNPTRSRVIQGLPAIPVPRWTSNFFSRESRRAVDEFLTEWEGAQREGDQPCCPAVYPIVVGRHVIFRDSAGVRSVSADDGKTEWAFACNYNIWAENRELYERVLQRAFPSSATGSQNQMAMNSLMGSISSDGRLVFAIDTIPPSLADGESSDGISSIRFRNRMLALQVEANSTRGQVSWSNDGRVNHESATGKGDRSSRLPANQDANRRICFLGPPLPGTTELLCVTEQEDEIHLTALASRTGAVLWSQPLCTLERLEQIDVERHETACIPASSGGIVVCPTNTGLLVAVDQARMKLLWAAYVDEVSDRTSSPSRSGPKPAPFSYPGFSANCLIAHDCVVYLSPRGSQLYCLDLVTGRVLWNMPRLDAEYVGAIVDRKVIVVGRQGCRCYSLENGKELWTNSVGPPIGCGLTIGNNYTLPLENGRLASIDVTTGQDEGSRILRSNVLPGHLAADGQRVYSLSHRGLVGFSRVDNSLTGLESPEPGRRNSPQHELVLAEIALVQGKPEEAERRLSLVLSEQVSTSDRERARMYLKGLLFERVAAGSVLKNSDCDRLDDLLQTPAEQFQFLMTIGQPDRTIRGGQSDERLVQRIYELPSGVISPLPKDDTWLVSPAVWCRMQAAGRAAEEPGRYQGILKGIEGRDHDAINDGIVEMKRFVRVFDHSSSAEAVRVELASQLGGAGEVHSAETLLLRNAMSTDPATAANAVLKLVDLWEQVDFVTDAARLLGSLKSQYGTTRLSNGLTGAEYVERMSQDRPVKQVWLRSQEPAWPVDAVEIVQSAAPPQFTPPAPIPGVTARSIRLSSDRTNLASLGRHVTVAGQACEFVEQTAAGNELQMISVFDQRTMILRGDFSVPMVHRWPQSDKSLSGSHFVMLGVPGGAVGVSTAQLADDTAMWTQQPSDLTARRSPANPGPWSPAFASFTWRNRLYVVDPLDGTLLWQRTIPMASRETVPNQRLEVIGDHRALAIQGVTKVEGEDKTTIIYDVFDTATGRKISTVRPGIDLLRGFYGRHVFGVADTSKGRRLQVRDLLKDAPDVDERIEDPVRPPYFMGGGEVAYIGGNEIRILNVIRGEKKQSLRLEDSEIVGAVTNLRVTSDRLRYFVNLQRSMPTATTIHMNQAIVDSPVQGFVVRDDLYGFDQRSGEMLWKRSLPHRTILQFPDCQVPFLVAISQVKDRINSSLESLTIQVIDSATGQTIGYRDNLSKDRILTADYDGQSGLIKLKGMLSDIELRFGPLVGQSISQSDNADLRAPSQP